MKHNWQEYPLFVWTDVDQVWRCENCGQTCKGIHPPKDEKCPIKTVFIVGYNGYLPCVVTKSEEVAEFCVQLEGQTEKTMYIEEYPIQ